MHLKSLHIKNFKALEDISVDFNSLISVIVGPNAIGKTTVLEAIRLVKAVLAPRTASESAQAILSLGIITPHNQQRLIPDAIARDTNIPVDIRCKYQLTDAELDEIKKALPQIATRLVQSQMGQGFTTSAMMTSYFSSETAKTAIKTAEVSITKKLGEIKSAANICSLNLNINFDAQRLEGGDPIAALLIAFLDQNLPPNKTNFSYFPADRALPLGEQPVQIGAADSATQIESHNSQPQLKYGRLKSTIFNAVVHSPDERDALKEEFSRVFNGLLKGRQIGKIGVDEYGSLSIKVKDIDNNREFNLDGMSSGEKGLLLTFLIIGRSLTDDGIVLIDEPELHLNPAVCKTLLPFLLENYALRKNLQIIVCSHSPEILAGAFDNDINCSLYHLISEKVLQLVRHKDRAEVTAALQRLGTTESEGLLYKATIFVEGVDDVKLLESGFGDILRRYKLKDLGGRNKVEKEINELQEAEKNGELSERYYFILDLDEQETPYKSSTFVKVLQWQRRCLENYLIDPEILFDVLNDKDFTKVKNKPSTITELNNILKKLAFSQLDGFVSKKVYHSYKLTSPGLRNSDIDDQSMEQIANNLFARLEDIKNQVSSLNKATWTATFLEECNKEKALLTLYWEENWNKRCDGKRLFRDLQQELGINLAMIKFKKRILKEMQTSQPRQHENWHLIKTFLNDLLSQ